MAAYRTVLLLFQPCSLVQEFPVLRFLSPTVSPFPKNILCACPPLPWKRQSQRRQKIDIGRSSLAACLPLWQGSPGDRRQQSARFAADCEDQLRRLGVHLITADETQVARCLQCCRPGPARVEQFTAAPATRHGLCAFQASTENISIRELVNHGAL